MEWAYRLKLMRIRKPRPPSPTACPACGEEMVYVERYTMMGDDLRTYRCNGCQKEHIIDFGTTMWKLMSDAKTLDSEK